MATSRSKLIIDILTNDKATKTIVGLNQALELAEKALGAIQKGFEFAEAGAQLEYTKSRFDRLAVSINSTGDVLEGKLSVALNGMMSDAQGVELAMTLMGLGLAKTEDQVVRLAGVASQLDMDMNQLSLTLSNQTTMRFDSLGVSIDGFDEKLQDLKDSGMDVNDAFTEAFLQQAEKQIETVGDAADSAVGPFKRFHAEVGNLTDELKIAASEGFKPFVDDAADFIKSLTKAQRATNTMRAATEAGLLTSEQYSNLTIAARYSTEDYYEAIRLLDLQLQLLNSTAPKTLDFFEMYAPAVEDAAEANDNYNDSLVNVEALSASLNGTLDDQIATLAEMTAQYEELTPWQKKYGEGAQMAEDIASAQGKINDELMEMVGNVGVLTLLESGLAGSQQAAYDLALRLGLMDEATYNANVTMANLDTFLQDTKDIDTYGLAVAWMADNLDRLHDKTFTITQIIQTIYREGLAQYGEGYGGGSASTSIGQLELDQGKDINGNGIIGAANGFSGIVPSGYPNDSFRQTFALSSGEHVQVTPSGSSSSSGNVYNIYVNNPIVTDENSFKRMIEPAVREVFDEQEALRS